jgi:hypothetical protein
MTLKIALIGLLSLGIASASPIIEIKTVAGKTAEEVEIVLGAPSQTEETKQGIKNFYLDDAVEIVFIDGKADWITITPTKITPFTKESLVELGLEVRLPTFSNEHVLRWEPYGAYHSVSMAPGPDGVDFFYVMIKTK